MEPFDCPHCGKNNSSPFSTTMKDHHKGLWCKHCGKWIKWLKQNNPWQEFVMPLGKYKGVKLGNLIETEPMYCEWISEQPWVKGRLKQVLEECMEWHLAN